MDVNTVRDNIESYIFFRKCPAHNPDVPVMQSRHRIVKMRKMPRAGVKGAVEDLEV